MKISELNLKKMTGDVFLEIHIACIYLTKVSFAVRSKNWTCCNSAIFNTDSRSHCNIPRHIVM